MHVSIIISIPWIKSITILNPIKITNNNSWNPSRITNQSEYWIPQYPLENLPKISPKLFNRDTLISRVTNYSKTIQQRSEWTHLIHVDWSSTINYEWISFVTGFSFFLRKVLSISHSVSVSISVSRSFSVSLRVSVSHFFIFLYVLFYKRSLLIK